jgi:hypothetical protein
MGQPRKFPVQEMSDSIKDFQVVIAQAEKADPNDRTLSKELRVTKEICEDFLKKLHSTA